MVEIEIWSQT